jgi:hypothetical protein
MAEPPWPASVDLSAFVSEIEAVQQKFRLPPPVIVLTSNLYQLVPRRIAARNASELVAALLVKAAQYSATELGEIIGDYRDTRSHTVLDPEAEAGTFVMPPRSEIHLG